MKSHAFTDAAAAICLSSLVGLAHFDETVHASRVDDQKKVIPIVFQAAGPTVASIQSMVDAFRAALGDPNNGNTPGPLATGRREINWDGGGSTATSVVPTPFDGFLVTRGARFTTRGTGFVQAPVEGLATTFNNPTYADIFQPFSPVRLFSPIDRNVTIARFFIPGGGEIPATTTGFGAVFSDVDQLDHRDDKDGNHDVDKDKDDKRRDTHRTSISFYGVRGHLLFSADVPASPGDASLSFLGVLFDDARIAHVRIKTGNVAPGPNDSRRRDVVMMDDFLYGEPQMIDQAQALEAPELPDTEDN